MSSLALHLQNEGHKVSGFDQKASSVTDLLERRGIELTIGDGARLPSDIHRLVLSSAISHDHPMLTDARSRGIEIVHRSEELSRLFNRSHGIAVAGSRGKTTTSALLTHILVACGENPSAMIGGNVAGYGTCTLLAETRERGPFYTLVQVYLKGRSLGLLRIPMPGHHNVMNSLAAVGVALDLGLRFTDIAHAVAMYKGVERRFELVGKKNGGLCFDDYAHNPQKVTAALQGALQACRGRVIALFQPHRYTRMKLLGDSFLPVLDGADQVILTDIFTSGEEPNGFDTARFHQQLLERSPKGSIHWAAEKEAVFEARERVAQPGDLIISLGAGSCGAWLKEWVDRPPLHSVTPDAAELAA
jgi:UDP-N-acetylmuramate-alanine ligase